MALVELEICRFLAGVSEKRVDGSSWIDFVPVALSKSGWCRVHTSRIDSVVALHLFHGTMARMRTCFGDGISTVFTALAWLHTP